MISYKLMFIIFTGLIVGYLNSFDTPEQLLESLKQIKDLDIVGLDGSRVRLPKTKIVYAAIFDYDYDPELENFKMQLIDEDGCCRVCQKQIGSRIAEIRPIIYHWGLNRLIPSRISGSLQTDLEIVRHIQFYKKLNQDGKYTDILVQKVLAIRKRYAECKQKSR